MDTVSKHERSHIMASIKSTGNKSTEVLFISILKENNLKGWRRKFPLYGKPDFVFPEYRVVIFLDGCFWHGCTKHCRMPKSNIEYWNKKINRNKKRDRRVTKTLKERGWTVMRFWEHEIKLNKLKRKISILKDTLENPNNVKI